MISEPDPEPKIGHDPGSTEPVSRYSTTLELWYTAAVKIACILPGTEYWDLESAFPQQAGYSVQAGQRSAYMAVACAMVVGSVTGISDHDPSATLYLRER